MPARIEPRKGAGQIQWSAGSWFGSVAGSTCWMLITAGFLLAHRQWLVASIPIGCFVVTNLIALALWVRREHLDPFVAFISVLAVMAVTMPTAWIAVRSWGSPEALAQMSWPSHAIWNYVVLLLIPAAIPWIWFVERHSRRVGASNAGDTIDAT